MKENSSQNQTVLIDTKDLINYVWSKKIQIIVASFLIGILSVLYTLSLTDEYTTTLYLTEVKKDQDTSLSNSSADTPFGISLPGGFGGTGNGLSSELNKAIRLMESWDFIDDFIRQNQLEVALIAGNGWDSSSRELIIDESIYDLEKDTWKDSDFDINSPSVRWQLYKIFIDELKIIGNKTTGIHSLSITSYSPDLSLEWATLYYKLVNQKMREEKLLKINNNINNLQKQLSINTNTSLRERLYDIQSEQIKSKALIEASPDYVFEVVGNPLVPYQKSYPRKTLLVLGITFVGTILVILFHLLRRYISMYRNL